MDSSKAKKPNITTQSLTMLSKANNMRIGSIKSLSLSKSVSKKEITNSIPFNPFPNNKKMVRQRKNSTCTKINPKSPGVISLMICSKNTKIGLTLSKTWPSKMTGKSKEALWSEMISATKLQASPKKKACWTDFSTQPNPLKESTVKKEAWSNSSEANTQLVFFDFC